MRGCTFFFLGQDIIDIWCVVEWEVIFAILDIYNMNQIFAIHILPMFRHVYLIYQILSTILVILLQISDISDILDILWQPSCAKC